MSDQDHGDWAHPSGDAGETQPYESFRGSEPAETPEPEPFVPAEHSSGDRRRGLLVPIVVAAVVAALIGGGIGATTVALLRPAASPAVVGTTSGGGTSNVVINDPKSATAITAVAAKASPSVVTVNVTASSGDEAGTGSGIVLNTSGDVLTNNHVVTLDGATSDDTITATTSAGRIYKAKVVGTDPINDLAVISLDGASGLTPATFADSSKLNVGDTAIAIGAPLGLSGTVTNGIVSALNRSIQVQSSAVPGGGDSSGDGNGDNGQGGPFTFNFGNGTQSQQATSSISLSVIQTDAAINPGNSGGALLDSAGDVIGVNVAIANAGSSSSSSDQSGSIGVGFAIPSNIAQRIANDLMAGKAATHGLLGATLSPSTTGTVAGATIRSVTAGGAAAKVGLQQGDVVTRFNGIAIQSASDLTAQVRALAGGATASLTYERGGTAKTVTVQLGTYRATS